MAVKKLNKEHEKVLKEVQGEFENLDPRVVRHIALYPFNFTANIIRDPDEVRPIRLRYLGVFDHIKGKKYKSDNKMIDLLLFALKEYGTKEIVGEEDNPRVLEYFKTAGHSWVKDDELAWCSAFINFCTIKTGYQATKKLDARSWLKIGTSVKTRELGDIVIFWRKSEDGPYGHVGLYVTEDEDNIYVLGGNQNNQVNISPYPKARLLDVRRVKKVTK